jgi:hypothetical protein
LKYKAYYHFTTSGQVFGGTIKKGFHSFATWLCEGNRRCEFSRIKALFSFALGYVFESTAILQLLLDLG